MRDMFAGLSGSHYSRTAIIALTAVTLSLTEDFAAARERVKNAPASAQRQAVQPGGSTAVYGLGGRYVGSDPDARIRAQIRRDPPDTFGIPTSRY